MKLKKKIKKAQKGETLQLGIGNDLNKEKQQVEHKANLGNFFGEENVSIKPDAQLPYNPDKPEPHQLQAVLAYYNKKYDVPGQFFKAYPNLKPYADKLPQGKDWQSAADKIAKENASSYLKIEKVITDPNDRYIYQRALLDLKKLFPDLDEAINVRGSGSKSGEIGFRTATFPLSPYSHYIHQDNYGKQTKKSKLWEYTGKEFKAVPITWNL